MHVTVPVAVARSFRRASRGYLMLVVATTLAGCGEATPTARSPDAGERRPRSPVASPTDVAASASPQEPALSIVPRFSDVARQCGIVFAYFNDARPGRFFLPEVMGGGASWVDYDNDGRLDVFLTNGCRVPERDGTPASATSRLFRNAHDQRFEDVSLPAEVAVSTYGQGCAVGDFNGDGFSDLYLTSYGVNVLLENCGDGTFHDITVASATGGADEWSTGAAWFDADDDGDDDLYVVNYLNVTFDNHKVCEYHKVAGYCGPGSFEGVADRVYRNMGDGRFEESASALGLAPPEPGKGMAIAIVDLDGDLRPEIYVANDMQANFLFTRGGGPVGDGGQPSPLFREVGIQAGCAVSGTGQVEASMGIACDDFDNDGLPDIYLTHYFSQKNTLYRNLGDLRFHDDSFPSRVAAISMMYLGFGTASLDFDRDGAPDLFVANGHVLGPNLSPNEMPRQLLHNDGRGRFDDVSQLAGDAFTEPALGRGAAKGDFDNDGDVDLAVANLVQPLALLRNDTRTNRHFLGLCLSTATRTSAAGGRIEVTAGERHWIQPIVSGGSYLASHDPRVVFGLHDAPRADRVEVHWPSGRVDEFTMLDSDHYWLIREGRPPIALIGD